jgi:putative ABC transport system permease protein
VTASALMIGLALVVFVTIFAAGLRATISKGLDQQIQAAGIVQHQDGFSPLPDGVVERLQGVQGIEAVSPIRFETGRWQEKNKNQAVTGIDPATIGKVIKADWADGAVKQLEALKDDEVLVGQNFAKNNRVKVGDELRFTSRQGTQAAYRIVGTFDSAVGLIGDVAVTNNSMEQKWKSKDVAFALFAGAPGADAGELQKKAEAAVTDFPTAETMTIDTFKKDQLKQVDQLVGLIYALLSLSVIVALLGIINTLALSVFERTRELGLLRAVGMSRRQVRRMVRAESVITAAIGALLGLVLGLAFAALVSRPLADEGFLFEIPVGQLIVLVIVAALAGVLAAIPPARRAARVDVLRAVTTE